MTAGRDQIVDLADGRMVAVRHYGDEDGVPVVFFHGFPGSRLQVSFGHEAAQSAGVHLVALDRPGFGLSDHAPGRTFGSYPSDVAEVADLLDLDRFGVVGVSGGGPYALACAARLADRQTGVAFVSGMPPPGSPGTPEAFRRNAMIFKMGKWAPIVPRALLGLMARKQRKNPNDLRDYLLPIVPASDREILLRDEVADGLREDQLEAFRRGTRGAAHESLMLVEPWDFEIEEIDVPVHVWQGDADVQVSADGARHVLGRLSGGIEHFIPEAGHYLIIDEIADILDTVAPPRAG